MSNPILLIISVFLLFIALSIVALLIYSVYRFASHYLKKTNSDKHDEDKKIAAKQLMTREQILSSIKPFVPQALELGKDGIAPQYKVKIDDIRKDNEGASQDLDKSAKEQPTKQSDETHVDYDSIPATDILVNTDGEPIVTKDLTRPTFNEIANAKQENVYHDVNKMDETDDLLQPGEIETITSSNSSMHQSDSSVKSKPDNNSQDDTDWDALFEAADKMMNN